MIITQTPRITLSCGHSLSLVGLRVEDFDPEIPKRKDGWYAAIKCSKCNKRRSVVSVQHRVETVI